MDGHLPLFDKYGDNLTIENRNNFDSLNKELGGYVENRTHDSSLEERWVLFRYLEYHILNGFFEYPVALSNSEQPDLLISYGANNSFGLEITESTNPLFLAARSLAEKRGKGEWPIDSCFKVGNKVTYKELASTLQSPDEPLRGMPWYGTEGLLNTRTFLKRTIAKKLKHYSSNSYQGLEQVDLLVYFTAPSSMHTSDKQIAGNYASIVDECLSETKPAKVFNNIHLLWSRTMGLGDNGHPYMVLTRTFE